jgi:NADH dehydrogenase [ubiquinone] 1 alpha subcomplex assembly factor 6
VHELPTHCASLVRSGDHDRFLSVLFAAESDREHLFALYAFNIEIARIRGQVSEPLLGEIRLQWWREGIEAIYQNQSVRQHPVLQALEMAIRDCRLPRQPFDAMIDAYGAALAAAQPASMADLERHIDATAGGLMRLAATITGGESVSDAILRDAALTWGLTGILRNIGFHASRRQIFLPAELTQATGLRSDLVFSGTNSQELQKVIKAVAENAGGHLAAARSAQSVLSRRLLPALLPAVLSQLYLRQIARPDYNPFLIQPPIPAFRRQIRMAWAMWRRKL